MSAAPDRPEQARTEAGGTPVSFSALIAEDEPLLARALAAELARAWPALSIVATVGDGAAAVAQALALRPDLLFLDIRMPGLSGLEAAAELADAWPADIAFPALVFVTAYDQYAVQAFEAQAVDYIVKPVQAERLKKTVARLQARLLQHRPDPQRARLPPAPDQASDQGLSHTLGQLRELLAATAASTAVGATVATQVPADLSSSPRLALIQASVGNQLHMVPIGDVLFFEAADKYLRVLTAEREYLIRTPLKELLPRLDPQQFWQVHRGTVVQAACIASVARDETGKLTLSLRGRPDKLAVSRLYAHLFHAM